MITETKKSYLEELIRLMKENPDLPVVPMVDAEICCGDDCGRYTGSFGSATVDEYLIPKSHYGKMSFKSDDDVYDTLGNYLDADDFDDLPEDDNECRKIYDELPWKKAIIVDINMPE